MGSGKSTVSKMLAGLGAVVIDADLAGHEIYLPDTETWKELVKVFGREIVTPDGLIDRKKLGEIVFKDTKQLARLNSIVHPRIYKMAEQRIDEQKKIDTKVVVLDGALLIEANFLPLVDELWVVVASEDNVVKRAVARTGLPEAHIRSRLASQISNGERVKRADVVIRNDGTLEELEAKVKEQWNKLDNNR